MSTPDNPAGPGHGSEPAPVHEDVLEAREAVQANSGLARRDLLKRVGWTTLALAGTGAALSQLTIERPKEIVNAAATQQGKPLTMLGTNGALTVSWYAEGRATMQLWAERFNVDLTWIDGQGDGTKQRASLDAAANRKWDLAAITAASAGTIVAPVNKIAGAGAGVFQMTSDIGGPKDKVSLLTSIEQSSYDMGYNVARALFEKAGGRGFAIQTRGQPGGTDQSGRNDGFHAALKQYPGVKLLTEDFANWDRGKSQALWETYLNRYPQVNIAYCQNDDMAFGALTAIQNAKRKDVLIGGCDGMPDAIKAVQNGQFTSTQRHSSCQIHSLPVMLGVAWKLGAIKDFPPLVSVVGPVVTSDNAASVAFLQQSSLYYA